MFGFIIWASGCVRLRLGELLRMSFENFKVNENEGVMEPVVPFDRFGLEGEDYKDWPRKLAENLGLSPHGEKARGEMNGHGLNPDIVIVDSHAPDYTTNEKGAEAPIKVPATYDYTNQLEFHKQEVAEAPKRGMPEAQVNYHLGKIAVLRNVPSPPLGPLPSPEQHQLDCKENDSSECGCKK